VEFECLRIKQRREKKKKKLSLRKIIKSIDLHYKEGKQSLQ
jgi:hypothetical protein